VSDDLHIGAMQDVCCKGNVLLFGLNCGNLWSKRKLALETCVTIIYAL